MKQTIAVLLVLFLFSIASSARGRSSHSSSHSRSYSTHSSSSSSRSSHTPSASTLSYRAPSYTPRRSTVPRSTYHPKPTHTYHASRATTTASTSRHGRIHRSAEARDAFKRSHPCPSTGKRSGACPGYVIDHIRPLSKGGPDAPSNMQWQTTSAAKAKDKWERK